MSETQTYIYRGPTYDCWEKYVDTIFEATTAVSKMKAATNIEYKLRQKSGKKVHIDRDPKYWEVK